MRTKLALTASLTIAALAFGACGGGGGGSDKDKIEAIIKLVANSDEKACDRFTDGLIKREFAGSKDQCVKQAKDSNEKLDYTTKSVDVSGDKATAVVAAKNETQNLQFIKDGSDWRLDQIGGASSSGTSTGTTPSPSGDEVAARGSVDAFLKAIAAEDETVLCGLLSATYASKLINKPKSEAIADCLTAFRNFDWTALKKEAKGVTSKDVTVTGDHATAKLSNGETVRLKRAGERWVIDSVGFQ
jgi:hypothetical protein